MKTALRKAYALALAFCMVVALIPQIEVHAATVPQIEAKIEAASSQTIGEDGEVEITLTMEGIPYEGMVVPNDIVLMIDRSGSMSSDINNMLESAKKFVDLVDTNTHRIAVVDYDDGVEELDFQRNKDKLKEYIANISSKSMGGTKIHLAVEEAAKLLRNGKRNNATGAIVLMTDGESDEELARQSAEKAKNNGYSFYTVALCDTVDSPANQLLKKMATSEADHYFVYSSTALASVYAEIAKKVGYANAKSLDIYQSIGDEFELVPESIENNIPIPDVVGQKLIWEMSQLGKGTSTLSFKIRPKATTKAGTYPHCNYGRIVYTAYNGNRVIINLDKIPITINKAPLALYSVQPAEYDAAGGEKAVLKGANIKDGATVKLGNKAITNTTITNNDTIEFTMPSHAQGSDKITVINPDGTSAYLTVSFKADPIITSVSPSKGPFAGGTAVTIKTQNVLGGASVFFGSQQAQIVSSSNGVIKVKSPKALAEGATDITIKNPDGTSLTAAGAFIYDPEPSYPEPVITSITPDNGAVKKAIKVTITGSGFLGGKKTGSKPTVTVGGVSIKKLLTATDTKLAFQVPSTLAAGSYDVVITNVYGKTGKTTYTYGDSSASSAASKISITSITPDNGLEKKSIKVTITGSGFLSGKTSGNKPTVTVGGVEITKLLTATDTTLAFQVPNTFSAGRYDVIIKNTAGGSATVQYEYTAKVNPSPVITSVEPPRGPEKKSTVVTINGTNLKGSVSGHATVTVGGVQISKLLTETNEKLVFQVPGTFSAGVQQIVVTNSYNNSATTNYTYEVVHSSTTAAKPIITSITSGTIAANRSGTIEIIGSNFTTDIYKISVKVTDNATGVVTDAMKILSVNSEWIKVQLPALAAGSYTVTVTNKDGQTAASTYTIN